jgi:anthranilate synthase component 1
VLFSLAGGAIGYVGYDCVRYFESKTARSDLADPIGIPESVFLLHDTIVGFDHLFSRVYVLSHIHLPTSSSSTSSPSDQIAASYAEASRKIAETAAKLQSTSPLPTPVQPKVTLPAPQAVSNVGKEGYERFVTELKGNIVQGQIIQAVPSQRLTRETRVHPFNVYRFVSPSVFLSSFS